MRNLSKSENKTIEYVKMYLNDIYQILVKCEDLYYLNQCAIEKERRKFMLFKLEYKINISSAHCYEPSHYTKIWLR